MVLAAVGVFAMVLGVLATLNLGQAVYEKIKLQNTADSAAYTLAVAEARTFNYLAFLNRAQIAHYNTAMVVQSYLSWIGFEIALYSTAVDMVTTLKRQVDMGSTWCCAGTCTLGCPYIAAKPGVSAAAQAAEKGRDAMYKQLKQVDDLAHKIADAMSVFNVGAMWATAITRVATLNLMIYKPALSFGMQSYIEELDKEIEFHKGAGGWLFNTGANLFFNMLELCQASDKSSGMSLCLFDMLTNIGDLVKNVKNGGLYLDPSSKDHEDSVRVMAELLHATRTPRFVFNRSGFAQAFTTGVASAMIFGYKQGQTKVTTKNSMSGAKVTSIDSDGNYPAATYLSSDDFLTGGSGSGFAPGPASNTFAGVGSKLGDAIASYKKNGKHYLYGGGGSGIIPIYPPPLGSTGNTKESNRHQPKWQGFSYYFKFRPNAERTSDYGQPSTWIFLNKHHRDFQTGGGSHKTKEAPWHGKWTMSYGSQTMELDTTIGGKRNSYLAKALSLEGLNVISRGMVYYHRPDNYTEHPNFFNPYWRARLAPVGQKLQNFWDKYVTQKIKTDSDNKVAKGMVNLFKNTQMDLFTAMVTSIITH